MKRNIILLMLMIVLFAFFTSCSKKTNYETDGPFIVVSSVPAGPDHYTNFFTRNYSINDQGNLILHTETDRNDRLIIGDDAPVYETQLTKAEVEKIKQLIEKNKFWKLDEDLSIESEDGTFLYITVHLTDQSRTIGGLNTNDPQFMEIRNYISNLVSDKDYNKWIEEIREHINNMNPE